MSKLSFYKHDNAQHLRYRTKEGELGQVFQCLLKAGYYPEIQTLESLIFMELNAKKLIHRDIHTLAYLEAVLLEVPGADGAIIGVSVFKPPQSPFLFTKKKPA